MISRVSLACNPGRVHLLLALILFLAFTQLTHAQGPDTTTLRHPIDLADGWLIHAGDDPAYARLDFDDTRWAPFNATTGDLHALFRQKPEIVWYRLHMKVAPDEKGMALQTTDMPRAFEIYTNGTLLVRVGGVSPAVPYDTSGNLLIPIPDSQFASGSLLIALRIYIDPTNWTLGVPGYRGDQLTFGQIDALREHMWYSIFGQNAIVWLDGLVNLGLMFGALLLYSRQRNRPEYLWLFLWVAIFIPSYVLDQHALFHPFPASWHLVEFLTVLYPYFLARMYCDLVCHRPGWKLNAFLILEMLFRIYDLCRTSLMDLAPADVVIQHSFTTILVLVILPSVLIADMRRGHPETGFLLVPLILYGVWKAGLLVADVLLLFPGSRNFALTMSEHWSASQFGSFVLPYGPLSDILSLSSLALIILIRSNRMSRRQTLLESEIASLAARHAKPGVQLDSWKEIAAYLRRDITTVQRWEKREGMPVRRHIHHKRGSVYAISSELDVWRQRRKSVLEDGVAYEASQTSRTAEM